MITTKILADSINPAGSRLTSFLLTYPRFIHSEFMTHRVFSRNAASSRAIPFNKMVEMMRDNPALPEKWGAEKKGMQSGDELPDPVIANIQENWMHAQDTCEMVSTYCAANGLHKSLCNRIIEPWSHITVLATATDKGLANFFALRAHPDAQPEFQVLAYRMLSEYLKNRARETSWNEWHIPNFTGAPRLSDFTCNIDQVKIATARCARLSYLTFDGEHSPEKDIELHDRLAESGHWSPFEHCAQAQKDMYELAWQSNFDSNGEWSGWLQYRKNFETENKTEVNLQEILSRKPEWVTIC